VTLPVPVTVCRDKNGRRGCNSFVFLGVIGRSRAPTFFDVEPTPTGLVIAGVETHGHGRKRRVYAMMRPLAMHDHPSTPTYTQHTVSCEFAHDLGRKQ
jgi:hypothetical protein